MLLSAPNKSYRKGNRLTSTILVGPVVGRLAEHNGIARLRHRARRVLALDDRRNPIDERAVPSPPRVRPACRLQGPASDSIRSSATQEVTQRLRANGVAVAVFEPNSPTTPLTARASSGRYELVITSEVVVAHSSTGGFFCFDIGSTGSPSARPIQHLSTSLVWHNA